MWRDKTDSGWGNMAPKLWPLIGGARRWRHGQLLSRVRCVFTLNIIYVLHDSKPRQRQITPHVSTHCCCEEMRRGSGPCVCVCNVGRCVRRLPCWGWFQTAACYPACQPGLGRADTTCHQDARRVRGVEEVYGLVQGLFVSRQPLYRDQLFFLGFLPWTFFIHTQLSPGVLASLFISP